MTSRMQRIDAMIVTIDLDDNLTVGDLVNAARWFQGYAQETRLGFNVNINTGRLVFIYPLDFERPENDSPSNL